jgi:predicted DNA binding CopG/RHH family protein
MRKIKLTKYEQWIEDHAEVFVPSSREELKLIKEALERRKKDAVLNIRINSYDLKALKDKARKIGVKYQSYLSEIIHRIVEAG